MRKESYRIEGRGKKNRIRENEVLRRGGAMIRNPTEKYRIKYPFDKQESRKG